MAIQLPSGGAVETQRDNIYIARAVRALARYIKSTYMIAHA
jgi:hypothetical protein